MCGIVGATSERRVKGILLEGLKRLEYRGYDSAGIAVIDENNTLQSTRRTGKVQALADALTANPIDGAIGVAHTRWATHGGVSEMNAHPHLSGDEIAVVHNGIIENHEVLREQLQALGYVFNSQTDTEVIAHLIHHERKTHNDLLAAVNAAVSQLEGAYGAVVMDTKEPERLVAARSGSPLVIGLGIGENFVASDQLALLPVTQRFIYLEEGDVADINRTSISIYDDEGQRVERKIIESDANYDVSSKGKYRHFMLKEIYEQPIAVRNTLEGRVSDKTVLDDAFGEGAEELLKTVEHVKIIACGTSHHAGMVASYWLESLANVSCSVEIASEFRYRQSYVRPNSLLVTISQSGETADTLAALRLSKTLGYKGSLTICNVGTSSLVRESDLAFMTRAGTEIGVASTKAFTTQLTGLLMLTVALGKYRGMSGQQQVAIISALQTLPIKLEEAASLANDIEELAHDFANKDHCVFLGRGNQYPIAMEGALKLKEISYIHAEAYASGELKHGPLALIDDDMPVIVVAPNNELLEKLKSNIEEVRARGGLMYVFADKNARFKSDDTLTVLNVGHCDEVIAPIVYTVPLQLLSYYVALVKGTDVDQPRNLAKSVTVE